MVGGVIRARLIFAWAFLKLLNEGLILIWADNARHSFKKVCSVAARVRQQQLKHRSVAAAVLLHVVNEHGDVV